MFVCFSSSLPSWLAVFDSTSSVTSAYCYLFVLFDCSEYIFCSSHCYLMPWPIKSKKFLIYALLFCSCLFCAKSGIALCSSFILDYYIIFGKLLCVTEGAISLLLSWITWSGAHFWFHVKQIEMVFRYPWLSKENEKNMMFLLSMNGLLQCSKMHP